MIALNKIDRVDATKVLHHLALAANELGLGQAEYFPFRLRPVRASTLSWSTSPRGCQKARAISRPEW